MNRVTRIACQKSNKQISAAKTILLKFHGTSNELKYTIGTSVKPDTKPRPLGKAAPPPLHIHKDINKKKRYIQASIRNVEVKPIHKEYVARIVTEGSVFEVEFSEKNDIHKNKSAICEENELRGKKG